jgi:prepilin-type N-terminal cleavage/methylation domain-containing protein
MTRNESGFTLIELVLVSALFAVVVGFTVPGLRGGFHRLALERAASEMEEISSYARTLAIMRGAPYRLAISKDEGMYRLLRGENGNFVPVEGSLGRPRSLPEGARGQGPSWAVTFFPNGTAAGGPLDVVQENKTLWRLHVDPVLGETVVREGVSETAG